jgi:hypothetical protein
MNYLDLNKYKWFLFGLVVLTFIYVLTFSGSIMDNSEIRTDPTETKLGDFDRYCEVIVDPM